MRRSKRTDRRPRDVGPDPLQPVSSPVPAKPAGARPDAPSDGDHNQGGARPEGLDYQRDLGAEQDA